MDKETNKTTDIRTKQPVSRNLFAGIVIIASLLAGMVGSYAMDLLNFSQNTQIVYNDKVVTQEGDAISDVASKVGPSVVSIVTASTAQTIWGYSTMQQGAGTGIVISSDGYIMTNKHVVPSSTNSVEVITSDGTSFKEVKYVGNDPVNDVAFLKIEGAKGLKPAKIGDSSSVKVGQKVIAIGNALGQFQNTVTIGIISALGRPITASSEQTGAEIETLENLIQTDAAINPGNSGGPLVNYAGEVIGINTAVASGAQGIGFAIPINDAKGMVASLIETGKVQKPYVGVRYISLSPTVSKQLSLSVRQGAYLFSPNEDNAVVLGGPADRAGLKDKDIITKVDGVQVDGQHPFASMIAQHKPGDKVELTYLRDGKESTVRVELEVMSSN
ncbi:PDZ domain-containing protein [Candidatus Saccharibacteria bacterium]|nr:PDZ domain-containing protein [Candidatus Saccharibacteria bacterium]NCU40259.1 PDZ domain-containing protein [Candidatus Saccharibacteria bacterium]